MTELRNNGPWSDPNPELIPEDSYRWRVVTKPIGPHRKPDDDPGKVYFVIASNAGIVDSHLCFWDASGIAVEIRANGTFETVTRLDPTDD